MASLVAIIQKRPYLVWLLTILLYFLTLRPPDCPIGFYSDTYADYYAQLLLTFCLQVVAGSVVALVGSFFFPKRKSFLERFAFLLPIAALLSVSLLALF